MIRKQMELNPKNEGKKDFVLQEGNRLFLTFETKGKKRDFALEEGMVQPEACMHSGARCVARLHSYKRCLLGRTSSLRPSFSISALMKVFN